MQFTKSAWKTSIFFWKCNWKHAVELELIFKSCTPICSNRLENFAFLQFLFVIFFVAFLHSTLTLLVLVTCIFCAIFYYFRDYCMLSIYFACKFIALYQIHYAYLYIALVYICSVVIFG